MQKAKEQFAVSVTTRKQEDHDFRRFTFNKFNVFWWKLMFSETLTYLKNDKQSQSKITKKNDWTQTRANSNKNKKYSVQVGKQVTIYRREIQTNELKFNISKFLTFIWLSSLKCHVCLFFWDYYIITKIHPPFQNPGSAPVLPRIFYSLRRPKNF